MTDKKAYVHSVNHLKNLLQMFDPDSKGYSNLKQIANANNQDKDTQSQREEFKKQWDSGEV